jgi:hypothetical protein
VFLVQLLSAILLLLIFLQDLRERAVYWIWFPVLTAGLLLIRLHHMADSHAWWGMVALNVALIAVQLLFLTIYFSWRRKQLTNITRGLLGWGDLLFLLSITVYFSAANFMFFYIASLTISLVVWILLKALQLVQTEKIPLAGFQAILLLLFLAAEWWPHWIALDDDTWLLNLIRR